ncbi:hypothetical protein DH2020_001302 [Rehmannia glutinosa]|uniref:Uncharacterized protein n=1 Tax=Rehmannia glutinosa TaxID=99300 RepID=A0ABR0XZE5_REHGL
MVALSTWFRYIATKLEYSVSLSRKTYIQGQIADTEILDTIWRNLFHGKLTFLHWNKGEEMAPMIGNYGGTLLVRKIPAADPTGINRFICNTSVIDAYGHMGRWGLRSSSFCIVVLIKATTTVLLLGQKFTLLRCCAPVSKEVFLLCVCGRRVHVGDVVIVKDPVNSGDYIVRRLAAIEGYEMASTDEKDEPFVLEKDQCWVLADNQNLKPKQEAYDSRTFGPVTMTDIVGRVIYCLRNAVDHGPVNNSHFSKRQDSPVLEVELDVDEMAKNHKA